MFKHYLSVFTLSMKLEQEIAQEHFSSPYQKLAINIIYSSGWIRTLILKNLKPYKLSPEQFNILRILRGRQPEVSSIQLITDRMLDKSSNASRIVEKLRIKGYLERNECPKDRRQVEIYITDSGLQVLKELDKKNNEWFKIMENLDVKEAEMANELLDKMRG